MKVLLWLAMLVTTLPLFGAEQANPPPTPRMKGYAEWDSWSWVASSTSDANYFVKRVVHSKGELDFWLKVEEKLIPACEVESGRNSFAESPLTALATKARKESCESDRKNEVASSVKHVVIACRARKAKYLEQATYNERGDSLSTSDGRDQWVAIFPDTVMESLLSKFCDQ